MLKWDTAKDTFEPGQWFKGRIYDRRCDLSPDGSLIVYFASKITGRSISDKEYTYAWTAVSRPPYFTALALWPKGDCWHGGGLFEGRRTLWLNHHPSVAKAHPDHQPRGLTVEPNPLARGEDYPVWSKRMARDGWHRVQKGSYPHSPGWGWTTQRPEVWTRANRSGTTSLYQRLDAIKFTRPGGYHESFWLRRETGEEVPIADAEWADWDQRGRLVFARGGKLYAGALKEGRLVERELVDLNPNTPVEVAPPAWAKRWR